MLIDSHCHLDFPELFGRMDDVIAAAHLNGVDRMITISTRVKKHQALVDLAHKHKEIFYTVGTHPHNADEELDITASDLIAFSQPDKCVGIGEVGLDYYYDNAPVDAQKYGFESHIEAAQETGLPLVIHSRDAEKDTVEILQHGLKKRPFTPLLHCFTASQWLADAAMELGAYFSFSGIITFKSARSILDTATKIPADRYLVETDAPYLAPVPFRGKKNEPAYVRHTAEFLAEARGVSFAQLAQETTENTERLFSKLKLTEKVKEDVSA